jgi:hypothetical protein
MSDLNSFITRPSDVVYKFNLETLNKFFLAFILLGIGVVPAWAQSGVVRETISSVLPVSPEAGSLGKFSEVPVSKATGIPNISIPLHAIEKGDINLNISLSYHSGGNRVDEIASRVGLGWSLNAGGMITRTVRGLPDDNRNADIQRFRLGQMNGSEAIEYLNSINSGFRDSEPDLYHISLDGISAKIFKGNNSDGWVVAPRNLNLKIEEDIGGYDWIITNGNGVKYKFLDREITSSTTVVHSPTIPSNDGTFYSGVTSWLLTEIEDTKGNKVNFYYNSGHQNFVTKGGESIFIPGSVPDIRCVKKTQFSIVQNQIFSKQLRSIVYSDGSVRLTSTNANRLDLPGDSSLSKIEVFNGSNQMLKRFHLFTSYFSNNTTGVNTPNIVAPMDYYRLKLDSVREESSAGSLKPFAFQYYELMGGLPARNSHAQDHWGFFNGQNNYGTSVSYYEFNMHQGAKKMANASYAQETLIKKITFPTGGFVEYTYEGNVYHTNQNIEGDDEPIALTALFGVNNPNSNTYDNLNHNFSTTFEITAAQLANGPMKVHYVPYTEGVGAGCSCSVNISLKRPNNTYVYFRSQSEENFNIETAGTYTLYGHIQTEFENNPFVYFHVSLTGIIPPSLGFKDVNGPGLRVKNIKRTFSSDKIQMTYFDYREIGLQTSSGNISGLPSYTKDFKYMNRNVLGNGPPYTIEFYDCEGKTYSSSSNYSLLNTIGSFVNYSAVTVTEDLNAGVGKSVYRYAYTPPFTYGFPFPPSTSQHWKIGLPLEESHYKKSLSGSELVSKKTFNYTVLPGSPYSSWGLKLGANSVYTYDGETEGAKAATLVPTSYSIDTDAFLLTSDTTMIKEGSAELRTINEYSYSGSNYQLARIRTSGSNGIEYNKRTYYSADYAANANSSELLRNLLARNMVDIPVEETKTVVVGGVEKLTSGVVYEYGFNSLSGFNQFYLKKINEANTKSANLSSRYNFISLPSHYFERVHTVSINDYGKPLYRIFNGLQKVAYVWGYNNQYPIAEIKNADYATVEAALGGSGAVHNFTSQLNPSDASVTSFLAPLKKASTLNNSFINIYIHKPIIGLSSKIDEKGMSISWDYDGFNRLLNIKNQKQEIITNYNYNLP